MCKTKSGHFNGTNGTKATKVPIFSDTGHVTKESISNRREFFLGKSGDKYLEMSSEKS